MAAAGPGEAGAPTKECLPCSVGKGSVDQASAGTDVALGWEASHS